MLKADLHMHSNYSRDCATTLEQIIQACKKKSINCVALTDHGKVDGALRLQQLAPFKVIVGQEVITPAGEIMGLFLKETIPGGLSPSEAAARIKAQGGLVGVPHPFDRLRGFKADALESLLPQLDFIEVFNSRSMFKSDYARARQLINQKRLLATAGSDAHTTGEIGKSYIEMPEFSTREEFLKSLAQGKIVGHLSCPMVHFYTTFYKIKKRFKVK